MTFRMIDVVTGRSVTTRNGYGANWKSRNGKPWWIISYSEQDRPPFGKHTEICLHLVDVMTRTPIRPCLVVRDARQVLKTVRELQLLARTFDPVEADLAPDGDPRILEWARAHGWVRFNHVWWVQETDMEAPCTTAF
jgi:hypothetical protein